MEVEDGQFDIVIDKGTLDALMSDTSEKVSTHVLFHATCDGSI